MKTNRFRIPAAGIALALALAGCGSGESFDTAKAHGVVTCNGKPVSGGTVFFSPVGKPDQTVTGKPATGNVAADGTFTLTTYTDADGAVIGKHNVSYVPVESDDPKAAKPACAGGPPVELEVKAGDNDLKVELSGK